MISPRILRRRIRSIQSTAKITKAMEMIATAKMKRAQDQAIAGRPYDEKLNHLISDLAAQAGGTNAYHPLLQHREPVSKIAIIHITSDRGLCGGLNTNINRYVADFLLQQNIEATFVTVGSKGRDYFHRAHQNIMAEFTKISDRPTLFETLPISHIVIDEYSNGNVDKVFISYNHFVSTIQQKPVVDQLLPIEPAKFSGSQTTEFIYEPNASFVLEQLLPRFIQMKVYHAILEAIASEHSARMIAMRNATDNANELIDGLTLTLNKARQEMITTELLDISGGVEVLQ